MNKNQDGFSLIELAVILVIGIAILATGLYVWHAHQATKVTTASTPAPVQVALPPETNVSTNCYSLDVPQKSDNGTFDVNKSSCRVGTGFQNGNLTFSSPLTSLTTTLSSVLSEDKNQVAAAENGHTKSIKQVSVDGNKGVCLIDISKGSSSTTDVLPANATEKCTFVTDKKYPIQDYETPPKTFTSNSFELNIEVYTTDQNTLNALTNSIISSIRWN